jgi:hypothetical protein
MFEFERKQAQTLHHEFNVINKTSLSSKEAKMIIHSKVNKGEIIDRFFIKNMEDDEDMINPVFES